MYNILMSKLRIVENKEDQNHDFKHNFDFELIEKDGSFNK